MIRKLFPIIPLILFPLTAQAALCSKSEVDAAIVAVANGGTITLTSPCTTGWSSRVLIPKTKGFTIDGNGARIDKYGFELAANASTGWRMTNFVVTSTTGFAFYVGGAITSAPWRIDHNTMTANASSVWNFAYSPGVFDHNTLTGGTAAAEYIHGIGWGAGDGTRCTGGSPPAECTGWKVDMPSSGTSRASGASEAIFFEDNTFDVSSSSNANNTWIENFYGFRGVFRFNVFTYWRVDFHGGDQTSTIGGRWWEFYANNFVQNAGGNGGGSAMNLRDGSGIIFANIKSGTEASMPNIGMCNERQTGTYPAPFQIGRGTISGGAFSAEPVYAWNNQQSVNLNAAEALCKTDITYLAFNRDVYTDVDSASCRAGGACTSGVGIGTTLPTSCTVGVAFWKTNEGNWNAGTNALYTGQGVLYKCTSTNTWVLFYTPYTYPHPLQNVKPKSSVPSPS